MSGTITSQSKFTAPIKLDGIIYDKSTLSPDLINFLEDSTLPIPVIHSFFDYLCHSAHALRESLNTYFSGEQKDGFTPIFYVNERNHMIAVIIAEKREDSQAPGELNSILANTRLAYLGEDFLASDCYGQLSCSSCVVDVVKGSLVNPEPRDEEFDMLSIDPDVVPTDCTRLSCQSIVGDEPLIVVIRAYGA